MSKRLHRALVYPLTDILQAIMHEQAFADVVISQALSSHPKWGSRDRSFMVETTQDMVRQYRYLAWLSGQDYTLPTTNQWHIIAAWWILNGQELPPWEEFETVPVDTINERLQQEPPKATKLSVPDWLYETGAQTLGDRWDTELAAMNQQAQTVIRVNSLKTTRNKLKQKLEQQGVETETHDDLPDALILKKQRYLMNLPQFKDGMFEIQDGASQLVAPMLDVQPGMQVIDTCAGGGGKSMHIATLMQNKGRIYALDVEEIKLKNLKTRQQRAGFRNIESETVNDSVVDRLRHKADRLLLDVPCSGLGVLKRNPDTKWLLTPEQLDNLTRTQQQILNDYESMLKPGGKLLYVTCSILPQEDEQQIQQFLQAHPNYTLETERYVWPSEFGFDGFYMALLQKGK